MGLAPELDGDRAAPKERDTQKEPVVRWPSPSTAVALTALFVALGGTSYAAFSLPKNREVVSSGGRPRSPLTEPR
jgi:hypothetical protein